MSVIVGIDLGTTNSCVAVPANADIPGRKEMLDKGRVRQVGPALVILDDYGSPITPSVVWLGPDGEPVVGTIAKQKARLPGEPPPAMYFKRSMGTDERVVAGHRMLTPQEASTYVLRHLKDLAEKTLGVPVDRAVVTVPAFFNARARNETTQAGRDAGLDVVETLLEPIAAALMHTHDHALAQPRTFLVYDLGGGTFDASVVSWDPEAGFENRGFHGDRFLGGYEFDKAIVHWIAEQLPRHDLRIDPDKPGDVKLLARLMVRAESDKHEFASEPVVSIVDTSSDLVDLAGVPMTINLLMRRDTFEDRIKAQVMCTLDSCDEALLAAGVAAGSSGEDTAAPAPRDRLDEIVMVGGSSRLRLVKRLLRDRYGIDPVTIDPDLCVAVGAAIKAAGAPVPSAYLVLDQPPALTANSTIDVSGQVTAGAAVKTVDGVTVRLSSDDGVLRRTEKTNAQGTFLFDDVPLRLDSENGFTVAVVAADAEVDTQHLVITHASDAGPEITADGAVLAHDIVVELRDGPYIVATAGTVLPYEKKFPLETANPGSLLRVRLLEGASPIGDVEIGDLPGTLAAGSQVEVELSFQRDWQILAQARVPAVGAKGQAEITIPRIILPSWSELQDRLQTLAAAWEDKRRAAAPSQLMLIGPRIDNLLREAEPLLKERLDRAKTHHRLQEADTLLKQIRPGHNELRPSWTEFEESLRELEELADQLATRDESKARLYRDAAAGHRGTGRRAYDGHRRLDWLSAVESVRRQTGAIRNELDPPQGGNITASGLKHGLLHDLTALIDDVHRADEDTEQRHHAGAQELIYEMDRIIAVVREIDEDGPTGLAELTRVHNARVVPVKHRVQRWMELARRATVGDAPVVIELIPPSSP